MVVVTISLFLFWSARDALQVIQVSDYDCYFYDDDDGVVMVVMIKTMMIMIIIIVIVIIYYYLYYYYYYVAPKSLYKHAVVYLQLAVGRRDLWPWEQLHHPRPPQRRQTPRIGGPLRPKATGHLRIWYIIILYWTVLTSPFRLCFVRLSSL